MSLCNRIAIIVLLLSFAVNGVFAQSKRMAKVIMQENYVREFSNDWYHYKYEDDEWEIRFDIDAFVVKYTATLRIWNNSDQEVDFDSKELKRITLNIDGKEKKFKQTTKTQSLGIPSFGFKSFKPKGSFTKLNSFPDKKEIFYESQVLFGKILKADDGIANVRFNGKDFKLKIRSDWSGKTQEKDKEFKKARKMHIKEVKKKLKGK
jgi:hypothetical protein